MTQIESCILLKYRTSLYGLYELYELFTFNLTLQYLIANNKNLPAMSTNLAYLNLKPTVKFSVLVSGLKLFTCSLISTPSSRV